MTLERRTPLRRTGPPKRRARLESGPPGWTDDEWDWRAAVLAACRGRCQWPGCGGHAYDVHHVIPRSVRPDLQLDPSNGRGLCGRHHRLVVHGTDQDLLDEARDHGLLYRPREGTHLT